MGKYTERKWENVAQRSGKREDKRWISKVGRTMATNSNPREQAVDINNQKFSKGKVYKND